MTNEQITRDSNRNFLTLNGQTLSNTPITVSGTKFQFNNTQGSTWLIYALNNNNVRHPLFSRPLPIISYHHSPPSLLISSASDHLLSHLYRLPSYQSMDRHPAFRLLQRICALSEADIRRSLCLLPHICQHHIYCQRRLSHCQLQLCSCRRHQRSSADDDTATSERRPAVASCGRKCPVLEHKGLLQECHWQHMDTAVQSSNHHMESPSFSRGQVKISKSLIIFYSYSLIVAFLSYRRHWSTISLTVLFPCLTTSTSGEDPLLVSLVWPSSLTS